MEEKTIIFPPVLVSEKFQTAMTKLLHDRIMDPDSEVENTLAELGYLHSTNVYAEGSKRHITVYFDSKLATKKCKDGGRELKKEFDLFENYLFVGDAIDCADVQYLEMPAYKVMVDEETEKKYVVMSDNEKKTKKAQVVAISCNAPITLGALTNAKMSLDTFEFTYTTTGTGSIETVVEKLPLQFTVTVREEGFDPDDAVPYLEQLAAVRAEQEAAAKKLSKKTKNKAKSIDNKNQSKQFAGYNQFS